MFPNMLNASGATVTVTIAPKILWIGFGVVVIFAAIMSIVLMYHWAHYGYKPIKTGFTGAIYIIGTIILLGVMFFAILSYTGSL